ncbi:MAG TPA: amidohydrolase family protein [Vicinamibacterales bacterium]|nr:amidohydrolase family protein [Vicinamibacterales bacterium]
MVTRHFTASVLAMAMVGLAMTAVLAQRGGDAARQFIRVQAPVVALTHVRVIDGTGAPARADQTVIIAGTDITAVGPAATTPVPEGATVVDARGQTVLPGLVMLHEHLYYPTGPGVYGQLGESFIRLYLAGGVTTIRTGGNVNGFMDINLMRLVEAGQKVGPAIDATAPYVNGPNTFQQMATIRTAEEARQHVAYWADAGATSIKAYMQISHEALRATIEAAHARGMKVTGHLCSVTYAEAAALGIDNLEHGFLAATDFVADKAPDTCPGQGRGQQSIAELDPGGAPFRALVKTLVDRRVALTSTLTVFETFTPKRPMPPGLEVLTPPLRQQFEATHARVSAGESRYTTLLPRAMALEKAFADAGGLLVAGTDPTGSGGVIPGFSNHRQIELLVEAGFSPVEAIEVATLNGARYLGRDARIGTVAVGKQADLVLVGGDPSTTVADVRKVVTVFRQGVGYDPQRLIQSVSGRVGIW